MVLLLHHRYRVTGGEERIVADQLALVRDRLGRPAELLQRSSSEVTAARGAAGLLRGGLDPQEVADAVRRTGADVLHAHNLHPTYGWRALRAARAAGVRKVVLQLHNYRLVCAVGTCIDPAGDDCVRCSGRRTWPGVRLNCRRASPAEALAYGAGLALQQRRLVAEADVVVVPSRAAAERLRQLRAPVRDVEVLPHAVPLLDERPLEGVRADGPALITSRLALEKDVETAIRACVRAGVPLVVAGDGPERARLEALGGDVGFVGRVDDARLRELRAEASVVLVPSLAHETYGLAALEAMALGLPVVASRRGALAELGGVLHVEPRDVAGLADAVRRARGDAALGARGRAAAEALAAPDVAAERLRRLYS